MKISTTLGMNTLIAVLLAAPVAAEDAKDTRTGVMKASDLLGRDIKNAAGESLGDVEDIAVDINSGEVIYMAVSYGETLGLGGKLFAVSPKQFTFPMDKDHLICDVPKATFESNKGFKSDAYPSEADTTLGKGEAREEPREHGERMVRRYSQMKDTDVLGRDGKTLGEIDGMAINVAEGKVAYAVLGVGGIAAVGEEYFAVNLEDLKYDSANNKFQLNATEADFKGKGFDRDNWPAKADRRFEKGGE